MVKYTGLKIVLLIVAISLLFTGCTNVEQQNTESLEQQIQWETELETTMMLLPMENSEPRVEPLTHIVIHFMNNAQNNQNNPYDIEENYSLLESYGVSAHYIIDREGNIFTLTTEDRVAYHAGKGSLDDYPDYDDRLNHYSIGIELLAVGTQEEMATVITGDKYDLIDPSLIGYTDAQYEVLNELLDDLLSRHSGIPRDRKHIIGHDEYAPGRKTDPGVLFDWSRLGF